MRRGSSAFFSALTILGLCGALVTVPLAYSFASSKPNPKLVFVGLQGQCFVSQECSVLVATAKGGKGPYTFGTDYLHIGSEPASIDVAKNGRLTGFSDTAGSFSFGVCVTDHLGHKTCGNVKLHVIQPQTSKITVILAGNGGGYVFTDAGAIDCGDVCEGPYDIGSQVTLSASADDGSSFVRWSGPCSGTDGCVIDVKADTTVTATFILDSSATPTTISSPTPTPNTGTPTPATAQSAGDCWSLNNCAVGMTGPGGGIIFYNAGSKQPWGQYLEVAPSGWSAGGDPVMLWCSVQGSLLGVAPPTRKEIGDGLYNTNVMLGMCASGAANTAHAYRGGGRSDWFLPSKKELAQLCLYANSQNAQDSPDGCGFGQLRSGFSGGSYWSSSAADSITALILSFHVGTWDNWWWDSVKAQSGSNLENNVMVRPIRAF